MGQTTLKKMMKKRRKTNTGMTTQFTNAFSGKIQKKTLMDAVLRDRRDLKTVFYFTEIGKQFGSNEDFSTSAA